MSGRLDDRGTEGAEERSERGDTLLEVLLSMLILSISAVAIMLAFGTSISSSSQYQTVSLTDTVLRSTAEQVTTQLQQQPASSWSTCTGYQSIVEGVQLAAQRLAATHAEGSAAR